MKIRILSACLMGATLAMSSLVQSASGSFGALATKSMMYYESVPVSSFASNISQEMYGQSAPNLLGAVLIEPGAETINRSNGDRWYVICIHPANGGEVSVNKWSGGSKILQVVLDPADPQCRSLDTVNPVVIDITEYGNGAYRSSSTKQDKYLFLGKLQKHNK